jgi:hypothetical protein
LLASAQSSALSPLRILGLPLSLGHALSFEAAMKVLIALTFTFLWCTRRGYSELASTIGAVAFGFSTFIIVWLHFPLITTACLLPAVFYSLDLLAERVTYPRFVALAVIGTIMLFGGHPETVSHTAFLAALYVLWIVVVERGKARLLLAIAGAAVVTLLLAAPFLAPFAEAVTKSRRSRTGWTSRRWPTRTGPRPSSSSRRNSMAPCRARRGGRPMPSRSRASPGSSESRRGWRWRRM